VKRNVEIVRDSDRQPTRRERAGMSPISRGRFTCRNCGHQTDKPGEHYGIGTILCPERDNWMEPPR
jgi:hypothetical protein